MRGAAVVLLSGGLDSTVALHLAARQCEAIYALAIRYGQRHARELAAARWQAQTVGVKEFKELHLDLSGWGADALTHHDLPLDSGDIHRHQAPNSYVPGRNMVFLAVAASYAEAVGAQTIYVGVSEADYSGYVDCRASFIEAMERAINQGTERRAADGRPIRIVAPFLHCPKSDEVLLGMKLGVDFAHTWSCYQGQERPCGQCDSCLLRSRAFSQAGFSDPLLL